MEIKYLDDYKKNSIDMIENLKLGFFVFQSCQEVGALEGG